MTRRSTVRFLALTLLAVSALGLASGCARQATPEHVALEYGRAVFANDAPAIYRLVSDEDRRVRDEATFRGQQRELRGFTRQLVQQLASYITATPVATTGDARRTTVKLKFTLPDANAPEVVRLVHDWDEDALDRLPTGERVRIANRLAELHRAGRLPSIEGEETLELVRDDAGWRVFLNWAGGARVRFTAAVDRSVPLDVTVVPGDVVVNPGERLRVTVTARNTTDREVTTRVGHRIEPGAQSKHLALLQCPLFVPVTLAPGETRDFVSVYLVLPDAPPDARSFAVTYEFPAPSPAGS